MDPIIAVICIIAAAVLAGLIAFFMGVKYRKKVGEAQIGSAETKAREILDEALKNVE